MHNKRPSDRELAKRLSEAKEFLKNRHGLFANPAKAVGELNDLDIGIQMRFGCWLESCLRKFHQRITEEQDLHKNPMRRQ